MARSPHQKERELQRDVARTVEATLPGVEVLALELTGKDRFCVFVDHPQGVNHALCERVTGVLRPYLDEYGVEVSSPGLDRPLRRPQTVTCHSASATIERFILLTPATRSVHGRLGRRAVGSDRERSLAGRHTVRPDRAGQSDR